MICTVCHHHCAMNLEETGKCKVRKNHRKENVPVKYGAVSTVCVKPVEAHSLARFCPDMNVLSISQFGCNMSCAYCSEHAASQTGPRSGCYISPIELVKKAGELVPYNTLGICFGGNEPLLNYEFVRDTCSIAKNNGLKTIVETNGCIAVSILDEIIKYVDAFAISLKGFTEEDFLLHKGSLQMVLDFISRAHLNSHIEITYMVENDPEKSLDQVEKLSIWLNGLSADIPLHLRRIEPDWHYRKSPANPDLMKRLQLIASQYLNYVYLSNV